MRGQRRHLFGRHPRTPEVEEHLVTGAPVAVREEKPPEPLPDPGRWSRVLFRGDEDTRRAVAAEVLAGLAIAHSPDEMSVVLYVSPERRAGWAWTRWLPHTRGGAVTEAGELAELVGADLTARPPFDADARPSADEPLVVVVVDGGRLPAGDRLDGTGVRNAVVLDLSGTRRRPGRTAPRLDTRTNGADLVWIDPVRTELFAHVGTHAAAVLLAPYATGRADGPPGLVNATSADHEAGWPPPLDQAPPIDHLLPPLVPAAGRGLTTADPPDACLTVPIGIVDEPFERLRGLLDVDLSGRHAVVLGEPGSGRSTLLTTLVVALALTHTPGEVQFYCLDYDGSLAALAGLPHVGAVAGKNDPERTEPTIAQVTALLAHRERLFADNGVDGIADYRRRRAAGEFAGEPYGDVFVVIDGDGRPDGLDDVAARGPGFGVHLITTGQDVPVADPVRLEFTGEAPGRGLTAGGLPYLTALPRIDGIAGTAGLAKGVAGLVETVAEYWAGPGAPPVRVLPARVEAGELPDAGGGLKVVLGLAEDGFGPLVHDFAASPHLMVVGEAGSGRTNLLRLIVDSITAHHTPSEARILVADHNGGLSRAVPEDFMLGHAFSASVLGELIDGTARAIGERVPGPDLDPVRLRSCDWWHGPRLFILVDDYEQVCTPAQNPFEPILEYLGMGYEVGAHVIVARSAAGVATAEPLMRGLHDAGSATLLLSCPPEDGEVLDGAEPRALPTGRGRYVRAGEEHLVQTAVAEQRA